MEVERKVRATVEADADYAFSLMDRCKFPLDKEIRISLIERRVREEMQQNGYKYWRER
jgi:hypothetical protein